MRDPYLLTIFQSVEDGAEPIMISLALKSGAVMTGYPRPPRWFIEGTRNQTRRELEAASANKATKQHIPHLTRQQDGTAAIYQDADADGGSDAVTLSDVTLMWDTGNGMKLHTVRIDLDSIVAWWVAKGRLLQRPKESTGGFWAVGVTF